jgi:hypothetical protein
VGIDFLTRAGLFEERRNQAQPVTPVQNVDSDEQERRGVREVIEAFTEIAIETHRIFGVPMPELEPAKEKVRLEGLKVQSGQNGNSSSDRLLDSKQSREKGKTKRFPLPPN